MDQAIWLEMLKLEIDELTEQQLIQPSDPLKPDTEHVVGIVEDQTLRKLWTLCEQRKESEDRLEVDMRYARTEDAKMQAKRAAMRASREFTAIRALFWVLLCETYSELGVKEHIGMRDGWRAVWYECDHPPFPRGLMELFGRGE